MPPPQQAGPHLTLTAIAQILGHEPDTILYWTLAGRLHVHLRGSQTIIEVDAPCTVVNPQPDKILIIAKPGFAAQSRPLPSKSGPHPDHRNPRRGP